VSGVGWGGVGWGGVGVPGRVVGWLGGAVVECAAGRGALRRRRGGEWGEGWLLAELHCLRCSLGCTQRFGLPAPQQHTLAVRPGVRLSPYLLTTCACCC
jgi:hypothetical protein